jgi:hypothetical protein
MRIKNHKDFCAGLMFIGTGVAFAIGALNYSFGSSARPGPGYFPFGLGILMAILGVIVLFGALVVEAEGGGKIGHIPWRPLLTLVASIAVFGYTLPHWGMAIALPILVVMSAFAGDEFRWRDVIITAVVLTLGSWLVFNVGLNLTIPMWPVAAAAAQ